MAGALARTPVSRPHLLVATGGGAWLDGSLVVRRTSVGPVSELWTRYFDAAGNDPRPTLLGALEHFDAEPSDEERLAVDLGCGTGRDTFELLRRGWRVLAIDAQEEAIQRLRRSGEPLVSSDRLETQVADFETARWPTAELVNASYALPFCPPGNFAGLWERITKSLPSRGRFCGQLFGDRDEWASVRVTSTAEWTPPAERHDVPHKERD